ncbi:MAG: hypothetical protein IKF78_07485 [Atopobiaceae bacterium]|nr:hypothetical protein [Atopobiaceae bacterium]
MSEKENEAVKPKHVKQAERAVDRAFSTGKVDRARITRQAQLDAAETVAMVGIAMESDEEADEAARLAIIASNMGDRKKAKAARERDREAHQKAKADHKAATKSARAAFEAVKFSDPNSLGFLRVVQIIFLLHIVGTLFQLLLTSRDTVVYDISNIVNWVMVILEAVAFYFFVNRYKLGKPMVIGVAIVGIVGHVLAEVANGDFSPVRALFSCLYYIFLIVYFLTSRRVKASLVNDLSTDKGAHDDEELVIDYGSWPFWRNLIIYFVVFSVLGHWMEAAYSQLIRLGIAPGEFHAENTMLWRDWLYPYPMHGFAVILMALILYPLLQYFKKKLPGRILPYVASYGANTLTVTLIELFGGLMFNANLQNWDYTNMPFNFMGQVCLTNSLLFGAAASIIAWWVYPMLEKAIARVRPATMNIVCIVVAVAGGILFSLYAISPPQGIDLGEKSVTEANSANYSKQVNGLQVDVTSLRLQSIELKETLSNSDLINKERADAMQKHVGELDEQLNKLQEDVDNMTEQKTTTP